MRIGLRLAAGAALAIMLTGQVNAIVMDHDRRMTVERYAAAQGVSLSAAEQRFGATGIVACGRTQSTAQLTLASDVITTTAHAFIDEDGAPRTEPGNCVFSIETTTGRIAVPVNGASLAVGSTRPYGEPGVKDWAVARLARPILGITPYRLATLDQVRDILLVANRHRGWSFDGAKAVERCAIRAAVRKVANAPRELGIDCSTGQGASGSAFLLPTEQGTMIGIYVGWRSRHPSAAGAYAASHQNYGLAVEGDFRGAIERAVAGR